MYYPGQYEPLNGFTEDLRSSALLREDIHIVGPQELLKIHWIKAQFIHFTNGIREILFFLQCLALSCFFFVGLASVVYSHTQKAAGSYNIILRIIFLKIFESKQSPKR